MILKTSLAQSERRFSRRRFDSPLPEASLVRFGAPMNAVASPKVLESLDIIAKYVASSRAEAPVEGARPRSALEGEARLPLRQSASQLTAISTTCCDGKARRSGL